MKNQPAAMVATVSQNRPGMLVSLACPEYVPICSLEAMTCRTFHILHGCA